MPTLEELMKSDPDFTPHPDFVRHKTHPTFESALLYGIRTDNPNWTEEQIMKERNIRAVAHYQRLRKRIGQQNDDDIIEE